MECCLRAKRPILSRSGQVMVEYILIMAMIVGIIFGAMWGIFRPYMVGLQQQIATATTTVLAQDELGIPIEWFMANPSTTVDQRLAAGQAAVAAGTGDSGNTNNGNGNNNGNGSGGGNGSGNGGGNGNGNNNGNGPGSKNGPGSNNGNNGSNTNLSNNGKGSNNGGSNGSGAGGANDAGGSNGKSKKAKGSDAPDDTSEVTADDKKAPDEKPSDQAKEGSQKEGETGTGLLSKQKKDLSRPDDDSRRGGSCKDINMFTLVKLAALLAILLLGAAVVVTAKGQKGD